MGQSTVQCIKQFCSADEDTSCKAIRLGKPRHGKEGRDIRLCIPLQRRRMSLAPEQPLSLPSSE